MSKVLFLTRDSHLSEQLPRIFAELDLEVEAKSDTTPLLDHGVPTRWKAVILDLDILTSDEQATDVLKALPNPKMTVMLVPTRLRHLEATARMTGALVLHKPSTVGEVGLALRILLKR